MNRTAVHAAVAGMFGPPPTAMSSCTVIGQSGASALWTIRSADIGIFPRLPRYESHIDAVIRQSSAVDEELVADVDSSIDRAMHAIRLGTATRRDFDSLVIMCRFAMAIEKKGVVSGLKEVIELAWQRHERRALEQVMKTDAREVAAAFATYGPEPHKIIGAMAQAIATMVNEDRPRMAVWQIEAHRKESENGMDRPHQPG